ncbi:MAG: hypothetical protein E7461_00620 [Ruminococcaceae bacterium]|nr:hypothetical protein [Oscillospiraceae bacterium]
MPSSKSLSKFAGTGKGDWAPDHGGGKVVVYGRDGRSHYEGYVSNITTAKERKEMRKHGIAPGAVAMSSFGSGDSFLTAHEHASASNWAAFHNYLSKREALKHEENMLLLNKGFTRDRSGSIVKLSAPSSVSTPVKQKKRSVWNRFLDNLF